MTGDILENESLARYTSWKIGGPARFFADVQTPQRLVELLNWADLNEVPVLMLGGGSNMLVRDSGFPGLVVRYRASEVRIEALGDEAAVQIGAGAPMAGTVRKLARQGYAGLEWAEGLPGTIGGAVFGNAGCYGSDTASSLRRVWLLVNGEIVEWPVERFDFGYRTSALKRAGVSEKIPTPEPRPLAPIVLAAEFALYRADSQEIAQRMARTAEQRRDKTPQGQSCGSVFKNPPGESAGRLIEATGLKGTRVGNAQIAQKHANYIVNLGGAQAVDVLRLTEIARETVFREFGIELELEVQVV